jgi:S1-C subfamily serine protease
MKKNIKIILEKSRTTILLFLVVGLALLAGIVGELAARVYLFEDAYGIPFFGNISFTNGDYNGANLSIIGARKVVVEQNVKVAETVVSLSNDLVGIFKKIKVSGSEDNSSFDINQYYRMSQPIGTGLIITSDGWLITDTLPQNLKEENISTNYVIITKDKQIYEIDKVVNDSTTNFSFVHAKGAKDFSVRPFVERGEVKNGQLVVAVNWSGESWLTSTVGRKDSEDFIRSSEDASEPLVLMGVEDKKLAGAAVVDLSGNIIAMANKQGRVEPINNFQSAIRGLLKNGTIERTFLGVNYIDLSVLAGSDSKYKKGAVVFKNLNGVSVIKDSPADVAGLKEDDVITQIDNIEINENNDLADVIQGYLAGDKINVVYLRSGDKKEVLLELLEAK